MRQIWRTKRNAKNTDYFNIIVVILKQSLLFYGFGCLTCSSKMLGELWVCELLVISQFKSLIFLFFFPLE